MPHAISYFLQQDYDNKELVIADDGTDCIKDIVPAHEQIRYIRLHKKMTLGEKRNYCIRESKGDLIMHWDDDDWMAPYRISYQVQELLKHHAEVCGLQQMLFRELTTGKCWLYKYPPQAQPWLAGGSLLYTRSFWQQSPFPDMQVASDTRFIFARKLTSFVALSDYHFYVASIHGKNTSAKNTGSNLWQPVQSAVVKEIMGDDWEDYTIATKGKKEITNVKSNGKPILKNNAVTACLLSYKRSENMQAIVDSIHPFDFIDEILVWNNNPLQKLALTGAKVKVIESVENKICYGRFLCAMQTSNEFIYVQDDDAIIKNIPQLYQAFLHNSNGITHALQPNHLSRLEDYSHFYGQSALLGWGAFFKKSWIQVLEKFLFKHQEDYLFRREADQIFSLLLKVKHNALPAAIQVLSNNSTKGIALYLEAEHNLYKALAASKALSFNRSTMNHTFPVTWNIVIPCKNYGKYLKDAVQSILYNTADYVITIIDDCSADNTQEVAMELRSKYSCINYIRHTESKGVSYARNNGIAHVDSLFVILLDADDKIGSRYLMESEELLRKGFDVANPDAILFGDINTTWVVPDTVTLAMQLNKNCVHTSAAFKRSYWAQVGGIDEALDNWQDYEFWIRLALAGARIKRLPGSHFYYRKHGFSKSSESSLKSNVLKNYIRVKHKNVFQSLL